jgi:hypothetical protein
VSRSQWHRDVGDHDVTEIEPVPLQLTRPLHRGEFDPSSFEGFFDVAARRLQQSAGVASLVRRKITERTLEPREFRSFTYELSPSRSCNSSIVPTKATDATTSLRSLSSAAVSKALMV